MKENTLVCASTPRIQNPEKIGLYGIIQNKRFCNIYQKQVWMSRIHHTWCNGRQGAGNSQASQGEEPLGQLK